MSKKNKALKQLLKSQMQANVTASSQGKILPSFQPDPMGNRQTTSQAGFNPIAHVASDKQAGEFMLIKKDIRLSLLLISLVIVCLFVIYFVDKSNPFLLSLANQIFKLISK